MTETARVYGGSLYELAQEEHLEEEILSEMKEIRALNMFIRTCSEILGILYDLSDFQQQFIFSLNMFVRLV